MKERQSSDSIPVIDDLYQKAYQRLRLHLNQAGAAFDEDEGDLLVSGHRLGLSISFEGFVTQGDQTIAPLDIQIHLNGDTGDRFRVGTLGVGPNSEAAIDAAIEEWHLLAATPVLAALGVADLVRRPARPQRIAGWQMFPGRIGIRGRMPAELSATSGFYNHLLTTLARSAYRSVPAKGFDLQSIFLMVSSAEGEREVQVALNGFVNPALTEEVAALDWPKSAEAYVFKQLFVLKPEA
jgi:hypothetical protein